MMVQPAGSDAVPVAQRLSAALDLDRKHAVALFAGDIGQFAVIHRLDKARLDQAAFEKGAAPFCDRQVHHIGHHVDTGHQPADKTIALRDGVIVHLVFGMLRRVVGRDPMRLDTACHARFL